MPFKGDHMTISTILSPATTSGMPTTSDTNAENMRIVELRLQRSDLLQVFEKIRHEVNNLVLTSEARLSKELVNDLRGVHGIQTDPKKYAEDMVRAQFAEKLSQDLEVDEEIGDWDLIYKAQRAILSEDQLAEFVVKTIAEWEALKLKN